MVDDNVLLAPITYPRLWDRSNELHPRGPAYDWKEHLRTLCRLCRELCRHPEAAGVPWCVIPAAERMYLHALATVQSEVLILDLVRERVGRSDLAADWLWWADPYDSHLKSKPVPAHLRPPSV
jgi:hypothetical protein